MDEKEIQELKERMIRVETKIDMMINNKNVQERPFWVNVLIGFLVVFLGLVIFFLLVSLLPIIHL
ncbi:hypothetical protein [Paenibacillus oryzisoli]|uniref:Uncharacterized protein n=1 Tax=Paenibacillus oryzisoli TaxID=1850517 RepID=A0A198ACT3_9BACL|nr:hypothetical protein [Paenibacillus oryzisoli]OAS18905.1 hypothetical protein A8708_32155 [Paenibacillus oryzisoli]